jgi:hypothetical protein
MKRVHLVGATMLVALAVPALALAGPASRATAAKVTVTLTDTKLRISPSGLQAGSTTFAVVNTGKRNHALEIAGPGLVKGVATARLAPGKRATVTVTLKSGAYMLTLSDPVGLGMSATHWLQVIPRTVVHGTSGVVQTTPESPSAVCGGLMP